MSDEWYDYCEGWLIHYKDGKSEHVRKHCKDCKHLKKTAHAIKCMAGTDSFGRAGCKLVSSLGCCSEWSPKEEMAKLMRTLVSVTASTKNPMEDNP